MLILVYAMSGKRNRLPNLSIIFIDLFFVSVPMKARDGFSFLHTDTTVDCSNLLWSIYRRKRAREKGKIIIITLISNLDVVLTTYS